MLIPHPSSTWTWLSTPSHHLEHDWRPSSPPITLIEHGWHPSPPSITLNMDDPITPSNHLEYGWLTPSHHPSPASRVLTYIKMLNQLKSHLKLDPLFYHCGGGKNSPFGRRRVSKTGLRWKQETWQVWQTRFLKKSDDLQYIDKSRESCLGTELNKTSTPQRLEQTANLSPPPRKPQVIVWT